MKNEWIKYWEENEWKVKECNKSADFIINNLEIKPGDKVFDIGCANGMHLLDIHNKTGATCHGIDISPIAIGLCKSDEINVRVGDMENIVYPREYFDKVFSLGVFEHTPNTIKVFSELERILKTKGLAYITVPNKISFFHITKRIKILLGKWDLGYERSFTKKQVEELCYMFNFKIIKFWIEPHIKPNNILNKIDNKLNKLNNKRYGFFINFTIQKESIVSNTQRTKHSSHQNKNRDEASTPLIIKTERTGSDDPPRGLKGDKTKHGNRK